MSRRGSVRFVRPRHPLFRGSQPVKWTSVPCGIGGCGRTPSSGFSERPTRSSRHPAKMSPTRRRSRTSRRVRALASSARGVLEDALAILGPQEVALRFEGLVVRQSAGRSRSIGILSRLPQKTCQTTPQFLGRVAGCQHRIRFVWARLKPKVPRTVRKSSPSRTDWPLHSRIDCSLERWLPAPTLLPAGHPSRLQDGCPIPPAQRWHERDLIGSPKSSCVQRAFSARSLPDRRCRPRAPAAVVTGRNGDRPNR